jgi:hypothetical protein
MTSSTSNDLTYETEKQRSIELAAGLRRMADTLAPVAVLQGAVADLRAEAQHVEDGRFSIVVLGAFNRGKSTLLNAMVGSDGLPVAAIPATAIISVLRYGPQEQALVHLLNGTTQGPMSLGVFKRQFVLDPIEVELGAGETDGEQPSSDEEIAIANDSDPSEQSRSLLEIARDRFSEIDYSEIILDCELLKHGVELVDPPGFEDNDARTRPQTSEGGRVAAGSFPDRVRRSVSVAASRRS